VTPPPPELAAKYLWDARRAAERVARFTAGKGFNDYLADEMLRSAVERQLGIVGEALAALRRADPALAAAIPELPRAVAFRNILVHGYASVDDKLVWGVVERDLAGLREALARLLGEAGERP
jgi:uncharacterized protein with HEPN domain